jgi:hypothetical protein
MAKSGLNRREAALVREAEKRARRDFLNTHRITVKAFGQTVLTGTLGSVRMIHLLNGQPDPENETIFRNL